MQLIRLAQSKQDFEGYFQGQVPDYAAGLIGTPSVDASQVQSLPPSFLFYRTELLEL